MGRNTASTPAVTALLRAGIPHSLHPYEHDPANELGYGLEAAAAIGVDPARVFKTLCVVIETGLGVGIVPVNAKLDLKAVAAALGAKKAEMAKPADAERSTGYVVGGISPIGQKRRLPTALDSSAMSHATVYVSGGRRGLDVGLAPADLALVTGAVVAPITRAG